MMADMPRPRPPHLHREVDRQGETVWYVRVGHGPRIRIREEYGTDKFKAAYKAALEGSAVAETKQRESTAQLSWLLERYRDSSAWAKLSDATRRQRDNIFAHVRKTSGTKKYASIKQETIRAGIERRKATPAQARNFLQAMRGLFEWARAADFVKVDPTAGIDTPTRPKTGGFRVWTEEDVTAYQAKWPIGTRQRVWLDVLLCTGLRRGDAVRLGRQHVRDGVATIKTEKSGLTIEVNLPILPELAETLKAGPCGDMAFICGASGRPFVKEAFGNEFHQACRDAKVPGSAHGLRKLAATRAANNGATVPQLEAIFGWSGGAMASLYTRSADRKRLAIEAMHKLSKGNVDATDTTKIRS